MATGLATKAMQAIAPTYVDDLKNELIGQKFGEATAQVNTILDAMTKVKDEIFANTQKVTEQNSFEAQTDRIVTWMWRFCDALRDVAAGTPGGKADLEDLRRALHDPTDGVDYVLRRMNSLLTPLGPDSNKALIALQSERYAAELASDDMRKTIPWYLHQMDEYLASQFSFQTAGLALQIFTANGDSSKIDDYRQDMVETLLGQVDYAYEQFPVFIKMIKPSYVGPPEPKTWWKFVEQHTAKRITLPHYRADVLVIDDGASEYQAQWRFAGSSADGICQPTAFAAPLDQLGIVRIQSRTNVNRYMDIQGDAIASIDAECRFKVAPQAHIDGDARGHPGNPCFKLIPEESGLRTPDIFDAVYRLSKDDIEQDFSI